MLKVVFLAFLAASESVRAAVVETQNKEDGRTHRYRRNVPRFNDPKYMDAFYLNDQYGVTMNIIEAWNKGYTGKNITVCISDPTGVSWRHSDIISKFAQIASYDFEANDTDPSPTLTAGTGNDGVHSHGTQMASLVAARANNNHCSVGVAYDAKISAVKFYGSGGPQEEYGITSSFSFKNQINDIISCSWGPISMLENTIGYIKPSAVPAIKQAAEQGRQGKGNIIVISVGNGGLFNGTCSYDEYISSIYTIGISVVTGKNKMADLNVRCSAITAVTYSRDGNAGINYPKDLMPACGLRGTCSKTSSSSSAAAAIGSGIVALVLEANPNLGWRDVQHLMARSSCSKFETVKWKTNKAGIRVSDGFGFGLLDAAALIDNAKTWNNVGPHLECKMDSTTAEVIHGVNTLRKTVDMTTWPTACGGESKRINFLEHAVLVISVNFTLRRNLEIEMQSPGGTRCVMLRSGRIFDKKSEILKLPIMSLQYWGENPRGVWSISFRNVKPDVTASGNVFSWSLKLYGTNADPMASNTVRASEIVVNSTAAPPTSSMSPSPKTTFTSMRPATNNVPTPTTRSGSSRNKCLKVVIALVLFQLCFSAGLL